MLSSPSTTPIPSTSPKSETTSQTGLSASVVPQGLVFDRVLNIDNASKTATVLAHHPTNTALKALVFVSVEGFTENGMKGLVENPAAAKLEEIQRNDKFSKYHCHLLLPQLAPFSLLQICPATENDILKYSPQGRALIRETPQLYTEITEKYIVSSIEKTKELAWVHNLVALPRGPNIKEEILFENDDFILVKDTKWNGTDLSELYCLAIVRMDHGKRLRSIRDLKGKADADLLRRIEECGCAELQRRYGVGKHSFRMYLHYLPSFWHLHVHFSSITSAWIGENVASAHAHLLEDVIDNLERDSDYYSNVNISFTVRQNMPLYTHFQNIGIIL